MSTTKRAFKRPFQPSIGSCFGQPARDTGPSPDAQMSTQISALPATIQCSLLNVGMRVRKSVSEGYLTQRKSSCGLLSAYNDFTPERNGFTPSRGFTGQVPYCGRPRTGHHNPQAPPCEEDLPALQYDSDDWGFQSSQESEASSDSTQPMATVPVASSHKRRGEDDELVVESEPVSPRSYPPFSHTRMPNLDQLRPIAVSKTRKKPLVRPSELKESEMIDVGDFGEADFFRPDEWEKIEAIRKRSGREMLGESEYF